MNTKDTKFENILHSCTTILDQLSRNIWLKDLKTNDCTSTATSRSDFNTSSDGKLYKKLSSAFYQQLNNVRFMSQVFNRINACTYFLDSVEEDESVNTNPFDISDEVISSYREHVREIGRAENILPHLHSIRHRVVTAEPGKVQAKPIVNIRDTMRGWILCRNKVYTLQDNSDKFYWKIKDENDEEQIVPSMFLKADTQFGELLRLQRVKKRLRDIILTIIQRTSSVCQRIIEDIKQDKEDFIRTVDSDDPNAFLENLLRLSEVIEGMKDVDVDKIHSIIHNINKVSQYYEPLDPSRHDQSSETYARILKLARLLYILKIYLAFVLEDLKPSQKFNPRRKKSAKSDPSKHNSVILKFVINLKEYVKQTKKREHKIGYSEDSSSSATAGSRDDLTTTETVIRTTGETKRRYLIKSVLNTTTGEALPLAEAVGTGLIHYARGSYLDAANNVEIPIEEAMADGKVSVEFTSARNIREDTRSYGIITVESIHNPEEPFLIKAVVDAEANTVISPEDAESKGILDRANSIYRDRSRQTEMQLTTAIRKKLVLTEKDEGAGDVENVSRTTYAVHTVVDRKLKRQMTFREAATLGIVDRETGAFKDTETEEVIYPTEAIRRGFYKAKVIPDRSDLQVDPENNIVINRFKRLRTKWSAISALANISRRRSLFSSTSSLNAT